MRTYFATTEELRQLNRNRWESAALLLLNGFSVGTSFPLLFTGQYFRGGLYALLALFSAIIWWRVRQRDGVLKQHIRERMAKLTQEDKDEIMALAYLLEKHKSRVAIIMFGCIHVPETVEHDTEHHGIKIRGLFVNTNEWPYQAASGK